MSSSGPMQIIRPSSQWGDEPPEIHNRGIRYSPSLRRAATLLAVVGCLGGAVFLGVWLRGALSSRTPPRWVLPAEFEQQETILLAWDADFDSEQNDSLAQIMAACRNNVSLTLLTPPDLIPEAKSHLKKYGVHEWEVDFVSADVSLAWTRDFGPLVLKSYDGQVDYLDAVYVTSDRPVCEDVPRQLAKRYRGRHIPIRLILPGGNILSNGAGLYLSTTSLLQENADRFNYKRATVDSLLAEQLGAEEIVYLEPLYGEPTGHVDLFASFVASDTVVVGEYDRAVDPVNAKILDENAKRLAGVRTACGPLRVVRIPMPPRLRGSWWTYTNVVFANGVLVVPRFPDVDPALEEKAMETYRALLKGWEIKTVDAAPLMIGDGGPRCATMNLFRKSANSPRLHSTSLDD